MCNNNNKNNDNNNNNNKTAWLSSPLIEDLKKKMFFQNAPLINKNAIMARAADAGPAALLMG